MNDKSKSTFFRSQYVPPVIAFMKLNVVDVGWNLGLYFKAHRCKSKSFRSRHDHFLLLNAGWIQAINFDSWNDVLLAM